MTSGLALRRWDGPGARTAVLLHSLGEDSSSWEPTAEALAHHQAVVAFDLPGHGATGRRPAYSFELIRDEVAAAIDEQQLGPVSIVGHSLGGMIGYLLAARRPSWLDRLVLEEAPPPLPLAPARPIPDRPDGELSFDWAALTALYGQRNDPDPAWWDTLAAIEVPTLVIAGGPDSHVDQADLARMADQIPASRLLTLGGGHNVHTTRPDQFVATVTQFLAET